MLVGTNFRSVGWWEYMMYQVCLLQTKTHTHTHTLSLSVPFFLSHIYSSSPLLGSWLFGGGGVIPVQVDLLHMNFAKHVPLSLQDKLLEHYFSPVCIPLVNPRARVCACVCLCAPMPLPLCATMSLPLTWYFFLVSQRTLEENIDMVGAVRHRLATTVNAHNLRLFFKAALA